MIFIFLIIPSIFSAPKEIDSISNLQLSKEISYNYSSENACKIEKLLQPKLDDTLSKNVKRK